MPTNSGHVLSTHALLSFTDPALEEGKGPVYTERLLYGARDLAGCRDNASFWYGNASTALTYSNSWL